MHRMAAPLLMIALLAACGGADGSSTATDATIMRDSAGVRIAENPADAGSVRRAPVMGTEPAVSIGEMDGAPEYQLYRVSAATRLSDGGLAVFDGGAQEVRYYDASGRFLRRSGGKGGGPGEFQGVSWMVRLAGDSLMLSDPQAQRLTVLAPDGTVARSVNLAAAASQGQSGTPGGREQVVRVGGLGTYDVLAPMSDGMLLARARSEMRTAEPGTTVTRDSATYVLLGPDGGLRDTIGVLAGDERQASVGGTSGRRVVVVGPPPFGRSSFVAVDTDGFWYGSSDRYQVEHRTADGRVDRVVRRAIEPIAVTPAITAAAREVELKRQIDGPAEVKTMFRQMTEERWEKAVLPATMPAHGVLRTDPAGRLWLAEVAPPDDEVPRWTVFDSEGRMLGTVAMPERFRALEFGTDYVLGVSTDENEVERVELYTLKTPD